MNKSLELPWVGVIALASHSDRRYVAAILEAGSISHRRRYRQRNRFGVSWSLRKFQKADFRSAGMCAPNGLCDKFPSFLNRGAQIVTLS